MGTPEELGNDIARFATALAKKQGEKPSGVVPGFDQRLGLAFTEDGRVSYVSASGNILISSASVSIPQVLPNAVTTVIDFDNIILDPLGCISGSGASWRFAAPEDGYYFVLHGNLLEAVTWSVAGRVAIASLVKNAGAGLPIDHQYPISGSVIAPYLHGVFVIDMLNGDTLHITTYQNSGGDINTGGHPVCNFQVFRVT